MLSRLWQEAVDSQHGFINVVDVVWAELLYEVIVALLPGRVSCRQRTRAHVVGWLPTTTYQGCSEGGPSGAGKWWTPACIGHGRSLMTPPLSLGTYVTAWAGQLTFDQGVRFARPQPILLI
jgi:hypothetical protein